MAYDEISKPISVGEANRLIKETLAESFYQIMIVGEISGFRPASSGHWYFDLKDREAALPSAVFKSMQYGMPRFQNGDLVVATGRIDYWEKTGKITFIISRMVRKGDGELQALIEKRRLYYSSLGWFDAELKKPIPEEIHRLGIITSPTGAAIQDILNITKRRAPSLDIMIYPCAVQGDGAANNIASRIRQANNFAECDVLIVGRGGGSQEDLSCFSEDDVIIAIHESKIPVISAVGHEIDFPLSDFVADFRAPTPSAAAELVTETIFRRKERLNVLTSTILMSMRNRILKIKSTLPDSRELKGIIEKKALMLEARIPSSKELELLLKRRAESAEFRLALSSDSIDSSMKELIRDKRHKLSEMNRECSYSIDKRCQETKGAIKNLQKDISSAMTILFADRKARFASVKKETEALSPLSILERGYSVIYDKNGKILKSTARVKAGDEVRARLYKGEFTSIVKEK